MASQCTATSLLGMTNQAWKKPGSDYPGQVNFALGQVKMDVWWSSGQVILAIATSLIIMTVKTYGSLSSQPGASNVTQEALRLTTL